MTDDSYEYDGLYDDVPGTVRAIDVPGVEKYELNFGTSDKTMSIILNIGGILVVALIIVGILTTP